MSYLERCPFPSKRGAISAIDERAEIAKDVAILLRLDKTDAGLMRKRTEGKIADPRKRGAAMRRDLGTCVDMLYSVPDAGKTGGDDAIPALRAKPAERKRAWASFLAGEALPSPSEVREFTAELDAFVRTCEEQANRLRDLCERDDVSSSLSDYSASSSESSPEDDDDESSRPGRRSKRQRVTTRERDEAEEDGEESMSVSGTESADDDR